MFRAATLSVFSLFCCAGAGLAQVTFALRMVVPCDATNASAPMKVEGGETFCLQQEAVASEADVKSAEVTKVPGDPWVVRLTLTDQGAQKVLKTTRANIKNRIGTVLNGRLMYAAIIESPFSNGIPILGHFTQEESDAIAAALNRQAAHR